MASGLIMGGVSAGAGLMSASTAAKAQKKIAKRNIEFQTRMAEAGAGEREAYSQASKAYQDIAAQNLLATESAQRTVLSSLGQPGTYGDSYTGSINFGSLRPTGLSGMSGGGGGLLTSGSGRISKFGEVTREDVGIGGMGKKGEWKGKRKWEASGIGLDADAMASSVMDSAGFRAVSGMVAEAEQFQNRQGEMWNQLNNSIVGSVYESSAAIHKGMMEQVARNMAQGGSARRVGLQMAQAMQVQEQTNRTRTGQLWKAKAQLEEFRTKRVQEVTSFAQSWVKNESGIRDSFTASLNSLQMHWAQTLPPSLIGASVASQTATQRGVLAASAGLQAALDTKTSGIMGAIDSLSGLATSAIGGVMNILDQGEVSTEQALADAPWNK